MRSKSLVSKIITHGYQVWGKYTNKIQYTHHDAKSGKGTPSPYIVSRCVTYDDRWCPVRNKFRLNNFLRSGGFQLRMFPIIWLWIPSNFDCLTYKTTTFAKPGPDVPNSYTQRITVGQLVQYVRVKMVKVILNRIFSVGYLNWAKQNIYFVHTFKQYQNP